jgi:uncharacterized membrane protein YidH (DUF202 family)
MGWWVKFIFLAAVALFFLEFGIEEMVRAYQLNNPHQFLASFFSASFIILISGTLLVAFVWRMVRRAKGKDRDKDFEEPGRKEE